MNPTSLALIIASVLLTSVGQLLLKLGASAPPIRQALSTGDAVAIASAALTSPFLIAGLAIYGLATLVWVVVLSKVDLSLAYPFVSLGFVAVLFPLFMWLGLVCEERRMTDRVAIASAVVLGLFVTQFATWQWVA